MEDITFWEYLKTNKIWGLIAVTLIIFGFMGYWVYSTGWDESSHDIAVGLVILGFVWTMYLIGSYCDWLKLTEKKE